MDENGRQTDHGLTPRGWQRAGALVTLFAPSAGSRSAPLAEPDRLVGAAYGSPEESKGHRPYLTLAPLASRLDRTVVLRHGVGEEVAMVAETLSSENHCSLICWEHAHIPLIASRVPLDPTTPPPATWPDERFDLIWCFERSGTGGTYRWSAIGQRLLVGDSDP